jgi:glutamine cyclotransferase
MKYFVYLFSAFIFLKCGGPSTPNVKIKTGIQGNKAVWGDTLHLQLSKDIEQTSVSYFLNDTPLSNPHILSNEQLGVHILRADINQGGNSFEVISKLTIRAPKPPKLYTYELINTFPHDQKAYTQGLEFDGDLLYESTGLNGQSTLRTVNYKTGDPVQNKPLDDSYFGEGLTVWEDQVIQLTWKSEKGFVYDKDSLKMEKSFPFGESKEGWGLCNDGKLLYKSDGSNRIWKLNPTTFKEEGSIQVMTHKSPLKNLNELEWVEGKIYANTYQFEKEVAVIIDPISGAVEGVIDFSGLKEQVNQHPKLNVLNGIAYHKKRKTLFVTGKNWDTLFEVNIVPKK